MTRWSPYDDAPASKLSVQEVKRRARVSTAVAREKRRTPPAPRLLGMWREWAIVLVAVALVVVIEMAR